MGFMEYTSGGVRNKKNTMEIHFQLVIAFLVGPAYATVCAWEGRKSTQSP